MTTTQTKQRSNGTIYEEQPATSLTVVTDLSVAPQHYISETRLNEEARRQGKRHDVTRALAQHMVRQEGIARTTGRAALLGNELIANTTAAAVDTLDRLDALEREYEERGELDHRRQILLEEGKDTVVLLARASRQAYFQKVGHLLSEL